MKRFITVLTGLLVLPAFAEVAPVYYDEIVEYTNDMIEAEELAESEEVQPVQKQKVAQRNTINRSTSASRAISAASQTNSRTNVSSRAMASSPRNASATTARGTASRTARTNTVVSRTPTSTSRASVTARGTTNAKPVTARVGTSNNSVMLGNRTNTSTTQRTLTDSGNSLYNPNSAARVGTSNRRTSARISANPISSGETTPVITQEDISTTTSNLTAIAELTDYCKAQYAACMDNYCNVLDDNQGRCSCSKNLKNYAKTEEALAKATEDFQEAVQKIKYIGLTGSQIEALFAETEAEISMKSNTDSSRLKNSLDSIKKKIVDVSTPTSASEVSSGISLDLNGLLSADFTSGFDLNSFLGTTNNTSSVSNQRGEQLFKTATNRCKTSVLNSCVAQGIDANVITNSYDLEIDKQCVAYERSLNEANTEMKNNVANATNILQQARLLLTQNKNAYDLRGCIAAIDSCMQDEYVCGADYELCLDPTGKYLANGAIVKGGTPGVSGGQTVNEYPKDEAEFAKWTSNGMRFLYSTWNYDTNKNAWSMGQEENLGGYIDEAMKKWKSDYKNSDSKTITNNMALYLLQKIGYIDTKDNDKVHGMCASAMNQCQNYTFDTQKSTKTFIPDNEVLRQYLNNTLSKIKVQQDAILADYAEGCRSDVQSCLSTNGYDDSNPNSTASKTAVNACSYEITTCMSVGGYTQNEGIKLTLRYMTDWVSSMLANCAAGYYLYDNGTGYDGSDGTKATKAECKICPRVPVYVAEDLNGDGEIDPETEYNPTSKQVQTTSTGGQVTTCHCSEEYNDYYPIGEEQKIENLGCIAK